MEDVDQVSAVGGGNGVNGLDLGEGDGAGGDSGGRAGAQDLETDLLAIAGQDASLHNSLDQDGSLGVDQSRALWVVR